MTLRPLSIFDMEIVRGWRHEAMETLRTPYMLTLEQQEDYYRTVICDRRSTTRYWGLWLDGTLAFIGYGGIENIQWENRCGELSLLIAPDFRGEGHGREAVALFLDQAFNYLNLENVHGECYGCGPWRFWIAVLDPYTPFYAWLPGRKYWKGEYHDSLYFNVNREGYLYHTSKVGEQTDSGEEHQGVLRQANNRILNRDGAAVEAV